MDGPELLRRQLLLRGTIRRADVDAILAGVPEADRKPHECEELLAEVEGGVCLRIEQRLKESVRSAGVLHMETAPIEVRVYWRQLQQQSRKLPVKVLEGGGVAIATRLGGTGKASLLAAIARVGTIDAASAAFDYPGAQGHVLELLEEQKLECRGATLVVRGLGNI